MTKVKIEILTPVHIGSGAFLQNNMDFIPAEDDAGDSWLYVIDDQKILNLIGIQNLDAWVNSIERGVNLQSLMQRYAPKSQPEDYSKRQIWTYAHPKDNETLKECMHDGQGIAYIPGSSIKGAIRTAVVAVDALQAYSDIRSMEKDILTGKYSSKKVEQRLFASPTDKSLDPQKDVFRFLRIGDAFFPDSEVDLRMINLNIRESKGIKDESKSQLIEAIDANNESTFTLNMKTTDLQVFSRENHNEIPDGMQSLKDLFLLINRHTLSLLESEIAMWKDYEDEDTVAGKFLDDLKMLSEEARKCTPDSCILRIGYGAGWRFITGAWTEETTDTCFNTIIEKARPKNDNYTQYNFPKTRRITTKGNILGFVKLTL